MGQERCGNLLLGLVWFIVMVLTGCAATHDASSGKKEGPEGVSKVYPVNEDEAWEIGKAVFRWEGRPSVQEHRDQGYMLSSTGMGMVAWGPLMVALFEPVDGEHTKVTVVIKRRVSAEPAVPMPTENSFHRRFEQAVSMIKNGEGLPVKAPD